MSFIGTISAVLNLLRLTKHLRRLPGWSGRAQG